MSIEVRLQRGDVVILDGGTGTELERRGVPMDPMAWCGPASLDNAALLEAIHGDYIAADADVITANTFASSRLMLAAAGVGERFADINRTALRAAFAARAASGRDDVLVAGSLSHMCPLGGTAAAPDRRHAPPLAAMAEAFAELATFLRDAGCDLLMLEMMYYPERLPAVFEAARATGLPVWAGFSARRADDGSIVSYAPERDIPFAELLPVLRDFEVAAAGIMHTPSDVVDAALAMLREEYRGPLLAYPDSGYFRMPQWQFVDIIAPPELRRYATGWVDAGVQIVGGCCGLSPAHIAALRPLRDRRAGRP